MTELIAYLDDNKAWEKKDIPAHQLTLINYAFANIIGLELKRDLKKIHLINELKAEHPHLKTCISIGGWTADGFSDAFLTFDTRKALIGSILAYLDRYDFNGVDLDWEYPGMDVAGIKARKEDAANYLDFVKEMRQALDEKEATTGRYYLLTAAIGAAKKLLDTMSPDENYTYVDYLDFVNVMTYDMRGSFTKTASHHTNLSSYSAENGQLSAEVAVKNLLAKNVAPEKIVIGGAFYGRVWTGFPDGLNPHKVVGTLAQTTGGTTINYNELQKLLQEEGQHVYWDNEANAPYYFNGEKFISFDSEKSLAKKAEFVKENHLRGLMYWEHSLDLSNQLVKAAYDHLS